MQPNNKRNALKSADIDALDKRTRPFKRYEAIRSAVLSDMGGEANTSAIVKQLISKFCTLAMQLEQIEALALEGVPIDLDLFGRCSGHLRRIGETLGLQRIPVDLNGINDDTRQRRERLFNALVQSSPEAAP
jgi:hypothetical protein